MTSQQLKNKAIHIGLSLLKLPTGTPLPTHLNTHNVSVNINRQAVAENALIKKSMRIAVPDLLHCIKWPYDKNNALIINSHACFSTTSMRDGI